MLCLISENVLTAVKAGFAAWALLALSLLSVFLLLKLLNAFTHKKNKE